MPEVKIEATGVHSLYLDGKRNHVLFCDLDAPESGKFLPRDDPKRFEWILRAAMKEAKIPDIYVFKTLKGYHLFSPWLKPLWLHDRFEERMERSCGGDGLHRLLGYRNGGTVLRVTAKPGEGLGPRFVRHYQVAHGVWRDEAGYWSGVHFDAFMELHGGLPAPLWGDLKRLDATDEVRLETYKTVAKVVDA